MRISDWSSDVCSSDLQLFMDQCSACHGEFAEGAGRYPELIGGRGTLNSNDPRKTVESYWPYAPTLYDYIRRAMPFGAPQSLTDDQVYSIVAWLLNQANVWPENKTREHRKSVVEGKSVSVRVDLGGR